MKSVKIPDDRKPCFECSINGKRYKYPAGATVSVPDEVADVIANVNAAKPQHVTTSPTQEIRKPTAAGKVLKSVARGDGYEYEEGEDAGSILPAVSSTDNGKVLKVVNGAWAVGADEKGDTLPTVSGDDDGKVLKVVDGEWGVGADATAAAEG